MNIPSNENKKRAVIYCRVSTVEQAEEGNSLATQEKVCREYGDKNGYEIAQVFIERGESAKTANRTELRKLLEYSAQKKNGVVAIIVYKIDRLSRNTDDYSQLRILLKRYGVSIRSTSEQIEDTPVGRFMENTMANIAQFDNDIRAERCSNGMRDAVREGRYVWAAPIGYSNVKIGERATIAPNEMAPLVRRAFELVATARYATDEVWRMMTAEGLVKKNGKPVGCGYFYKMLQNELYTTWVEKFGERHKGLFEPVITEDLFAQVQRVMKNKGHKVSQYKTDNPAFPLRRFVFNPNGLKLTGSFARGKYPSYRFNGASGNYERDELERRFTFLMDSYRFESRDMLKLKQFVREKFHGATEKERAEATKLETYLKELAERRTALVQKNLKGVISDAVLKEQLGIMEKAEIETQSTLALLGSATGSPEEAVEFATEYLEQPSKTWRKSGIATQMKLQWFQFPLGTTFDGKIFGTPKVCSVFKAKELILSPFSTGVVIIPKSSDSFPAEPRMMCHARSAWWL
jgi:DNA invertase Pin-like site-specific DNA recombinase